MNNDSRNLGLDIVRSLAIIMVMISHSRMFFQAYNLQFLSICGLLGVEIFFVLSGFLIGKIILNKLVDNPSINSLKEFYIRRWFRTLPLYYLVLFLVAIINSQSIPYRNFVFLQNFNENALGFLAISWSLSVEEWFYLLVPFMLLICVKLLDGRIKRKNIFFIVTISIALISFLLRFYTILKFNPTWDYGVRKQIFLRLDAMMLGVILAGIKKYYKNIYNKFTSTKLPLVISILGFLIIGYVYIGKLGAGNTFDNFIIWKIFLFNIISLVCVFWISWFETSSIINKKFAQYKISKTFNFISITSYCVYLIHYNIYGMLSLRAQGFKELILAIFITLVIASLINKYYEIPITNLRDKINFSEKRTIMNDVKV